jgi:hypothetical protein
MRVALDPMPALKQRTVDQINAHFDGLARPHRDAAHAMKRNVASVVMGNPARAPDWFSQEADLRGITPTAFANLILSKGDTVADRELQRQRAMAAVDAAATPAALSAIVDKLRSP